MKRLLVAPTIIEFGWVLCAYIPHARYRAREFDETIVCVPPGEEYLVKDFATGYEYWKKPDRADRWLIKNGRPVKVPEMIRRKYPNSVWMRPEEKTCTTKKRKYIRYGEVVDALRYDVVIHARAATKYGQGNRNYNPKWFAHIVKKMGVRACSVGTQAYFIEGTDDKRHIDVEMLANIMRSSKLVIGPSSGPMHLASLCGTPHVVFSGNKYDKAIKGTNRDRYESIWNPHKTPCTILDRDKWHPKPDKVMKAMEKYL